MAPHRQDRGQTSAACKDVVGRKRAVATKVPAKIPSSLTGTDSDPLVVKARAIFDQAGDNTTKGTLRACYKAVLDAEKLGEPCELYTGSFYFGLPLVNAGMLDTYLYSMDVLGEVPLGRTGDGSTIVNDVFASEYYTNIVRFNGELYAVCSKFLGMKNLPAWESKDVLTLPTPYLLDFFFNIVKLGIKTEKEIEHFLNAEPDTTVQSRLLDVDDVEDLILKGQHVKFDAEAIEEAIALSTEIFEFAKKSLVAMGMMQVLV